MLMASGSGAGVAGGWFWMLLALLALVHVSTTYSLGMLRSSAFPGAIFHHVVRLSAFLFFACSVLGIAGYALNEVFLYWFPNLLFSFALLGALFGLHLGPVKLARHAQTVVVGTMLIGLMVLMLGFFSAPPLTGADTPGFFDAVAQRPLWEGLIFLAPLCIGFELGFSNPAADARERHVMAASILTALIVLGIWSSFSLRVAGAERLAESTVPHMIGARRIMGQTGRLIMGGIVILGSFAACNAILLALRSAFKGKGTEGRCAGSSLPQRLILAGLPCLAIGTLLLLGYAGEPVTESYIAGGLALWLISYACIHIVALRHGKGVRAWAGFGLAGNLLLMACLFTVAPEPQQAVAYACGSALVAVALHKLGSRGGLVGLYPKEQFPKRMEEPDEKT